MEPVSVSIVCFLLALNVYLSLKNSIPILGLSVGLLTSIIGIGIINNGVDFPFQPNFSLIVVVVSVICLVSAGVDMKKKRGRRR